MSIDAGLGTAWSDGGDGVSAATTAFHPAASPTARFGGGEGAGTAGLRCRLRRAAVASSAGPPPRSATSPL